MATFTPRFNLYGPTPSAAASQQAPWTAFYTQQNNVNEQNRAAAVLQSIRLEEIERARAQEAARFNALQRLDATRYAQREALQARSDAESARRFNLGLALDAAQHGEATRARRREFDINTDVAREGLRVKREGFEPAPTATEILADQIDALNSETARTIATQLNNALKLKQQVNRGATLTPQERFEAMQIDPTTATLIAQSLAEKIGRVPPQVRFDADTNTWTTEAPKSRFAPVMGALRESERPMQPTPPPTTTGRSAGVPFTVYGRGGQTTNAIDFSQPSTTTVQPPPAAVEFLRRNPQHSAEFDEKYGDGAAARALSGRP